MRARALPRLTFEDIANVPAWALLPAADVRTLAVIAGCIVFVRPLQREIDGRVLGALANAIGHARLDAILCGDAANSPAIKWIRSKDPVHDLGAIGGEVLVRAARAGAPLQARLRAMFPPLAQALVSCAVTVAADADEVTRAALVHYAGGESTGGGA